MNFSSKVYSKNLLKGLYDVTCPLLYHFVIRYNVYILKDPKNSSISSPQYGIFQKVIVFKDFVKFLENRKYMEGLLCTFQFLGGCQGRRTGVGVTTVSNSLILGGWVTNVLKNDDENTGEWGRRVGDNSILTFLCYWLDKNATLKNCILGNFFYS